MDSGNNENRATQVVGDYTVTVVKVIPTPKSGEIVEQEDYEVTLVVEQKYH